MLPPPKSGKFIFLGVIALELGCGFESCKLSNNYCTRGISIKLGLVGGFLVGDNFFSRGVCY